MGNHDKYANSSQGRNTIRDQTYWENYGRWWNYNFPQHSTFCKWQNRCAHRPSQHFS